MSVNIVLTNQKGGVGKTTTTCALAAGLSRQGKKVLAIDLDPQGNMGFSLGLDAEIDSTVYEVMKGSCGIRQAIYETEYCDIVPSNILLSTFDVENEGGGREILLKQALEEVKDSYDYIVMDTPPALNLLTLNAYAAAHYLIIPMSAEILSLVGLAQLKETVDSIRGEVNPGMQVLGILLTKFNKRTRLANDVKEMAEAVAGQIGTTLFQVSVRNGVAAAEAPAHGESIYDYSPRSNPSKDYQMFVDEVLERTGGKNALEA